MGEHANRGPVPEGADGVRFLVLWSEKRAGKGEDAVPVARPVRPGEGAVAVCDGLGGAGAAVVDTEHGEQSQARLAARLAGAVLDECLAELPPIGAGDVAAADALADALSHELATAMSRYGLGGGRLRSKLIRTLPTTLALGRYAWDARGLRCEAIWAGDSRVYLFTPVHGLQQLSDDDLRSGGDALANLQQDSPLSNLVSASGTFVLHSRVVDPVPEPAVLFAATDGCFGYVPTPWHFEQLLLNALREADSFDAWGELVSAAIGQVTGDDAALGAAVLGAASFADLKQRFGWRAAEVDELVRQLDTVVRRRDGLRQELAAAEAAVADLLADQWRGYRLRFEGWLSGAPRHTTQPRSAKASPVPAAAAAPPAAPVPAPAGPVADGAVAPARGVAPVEHACPTCGRIHRDEETEHGPRG